MHYIHEGGQRKMGLSQYSKYVRNWFDLVPQYLIVEVSIVTRCFKTTDATAVMLVWL